MASKKMGIAIGAVLFVLIAGTLGILALEQSVVAEYEAVNSWRDTPEGMKNAFCHSAGINWDTCMNNARVITDFYGNSKVSMPSLQKVTQTITTTEPNFESPINLKVLKIQTGNLSEQIPRLDNENNLPIERCEYLTNLIVEVEGKLNFQQQNYHVGPLLETLQQLEKDYC